MRNLDRSPRRTKEIAEALEQALVDGVHVLHPPKLELSPSPFVVHERTLPRPPREVPMPSQPAGSRRREVEPPPFDLEYAILADGSPMHVSSSREGLCNLQAPDGLLVEFVAELKFETGGWEMEGLFATHQPRPGCTHLSPWTKPGETLGFRDYLVTHDYKWAIRCQSVMEITINGVRRWVAKGWHPMTAYPRLTR